MEGVGIRTRAMRPDEAPVVADLLVAANEEHLATFPPDIAAAYRAELAHTRGRPRSAEVHVAEQAGSVVATVTLVPDASEDSHPWPPGGSVIRFLAVAPEARRQGLGERLTVLCVERARAAGASFVGLHTAPVMTAACRLYERLGFARAPEHDFDPAAHYGGAPAERDRWGLAYVLRLTPAGS